MISVQFRGTLKDGLREIAKQGGLNLVVTGDLDRPSEVYLNGVSAEEAITTVARAYQLKLAHQGSIFTLRPMTHDEQEASEEAASPTVPVPPLPPLGTGASDLKGPTQADSKESDDDEDEANQNEDDKADASAVKARVLRHLGKHSGDDRTAAGPVVVEKGQVVSNAVSYGGRVTLREGAVVEGDTVGFGGAVELERGAVVEGDVVAFGGDVILGQGAVVHGDAISIGGVVRKGQGAMVEGDEVSIGGGVKRGLGALSVVKGTHHSRHSPDSDSKDTAAPERESPSAFAGLAGFFLSYALEFGIGFLFLMFAPARMKQLEGELRRQLLKCVTTGLVGAVALLPLTAALVVLVIGIPFAVALWIMVGLGIAMGATAVASEIGLRLPVLRARKSQAVVLALGLLVMLLVARIPVIGVLMGIAVVLLSLGAIIRTRFGQPTRGFPEADHGLAPL